MGRVEIITGRERRRSPSVEEKLGILSEALVPGVSMAAVARRHDYYPQQLYKWRRELTEAGLIAESTPNQPTFLPVELAQPELRPRGRPPGRSKLVEVALANGRTLRVAPDIDPEMLRRLVRALEEA
ncbi:MAG: transposase [Pseudomonadota bacterium]